MIKQWFYLSLLGYWFVSKARGLIENICCFCCPTSFTLFFWHLELPSLGKCFFHTLSKLFGRGLPIVDGTPSSRPWYGSCSDWANRYTHPKTPHPSHMLMIVNWHLFPWASREEHSFSLWLVDCKDMYLKQPSIVVLYPVQITHLRKWMIHAKEVVARTRKKKEKILGLFKAHLTVPVPQSYHISQ